MPAEVTDDPHRPAVDTEQLLDDIKSMSLADADREKLVNFYLQRLINVVAEPEKITSQEAAGGLSVVGCRELAGRRDIRPK